MYQIYAQALFRLGLGKTKAEQTRLVDKLILMLKKRGHTSLSLKIAKEVARLQEAHDKKEKVLLTLSEKDHLKRFERSVENVSEEIFSGIKDQEVRIDKTLIGGFTLSHKGTRVDRSFKHHLLTLFTTLTKTN